MSAFRCPKCGRVFLTEEIAAKFCPGCHARIGEGEHLAMPGKAQGSSEKGPWKNVLFVAGLVVPLVLGVGVFVYTRSLNSVPPPLTAALPTVASNNPSTSVVVKPVAENAVQPASQAKAPSDSQATTAQVVNLPPTKPPEVQPARQPEVTREAFALPDKNTPRLAGGLFLNNGEHVPAEIISLDESQVVYRRRHRTEKESILLSKVSMVLFHPLAESRRAALEHPVPGLLLRNGDFVAGRAQSMQQKQIAVSSAVAGLKSYSLSEAMALILPREKN